jgi:hypothetical protein
MTMLRPTHRIQRNRIVSVLVALGSALAFQSAALAGVEVMAQGKTQYKSRKPKPEHKAMAIEEAKKNALDQYSAELPISARKNYLVIESKLKGNVDKYVLDYLELEDEIDKDSKTYTVFIRATVDKTLIDIEIQNVAGGGRSAESEYILFTFAARSQDQVKGFKDRDTTRTDSDSTDDVEETTASDGQTIVSSTSRNVSKIAATGGSTVRREEQISYRVFSSEDVDNAITQVFTEANFEVVPIFEVDERIGILFRDDFGKGDDVSGANRKYATDLTRDSGVPFFAYGLLDVGKSRVDKATGQDVVTVRVNAKIFDLKKRFARTVASVGPVQYRGAGATVTEAQSNALHTAAQKAAEELVNQLMAKGIR